MHLCQLLQTQGSLFDSRSIMLGGKSGNVPLNIGTSFEVPKIKNEFIRSGQTDSRYFNDVLKGHLTRPPPSSQDKCADY